VHSTFRKLRLVRTPAACKKQSARRAAQKWHKIRGRPTRGTSRPPNLAHDTSFKGRTSATCEGIVRQAVNSISNPRHEPRSGGSRAGIFLPRPHQPCPGLSPILARCRPSLVRAAPPLPACRSPSAWTSSERGPPRSNSEDARAWR